MHVVGARPNFIKVAPVMNALSRKDVVRQTMVHTGQHYDDNMSEVFFSQLGILEPDLSLGVGSGSHAQQTAQVMSRFEAVVLERKRDVVLVYGDVNSTVAAALVCAKLLIPVGHVEAGLRSFDRTMPEEINRLLTDQIADLLFTPSADGDENLLREGIAKEKIHFVGNVMIDTVVKFLPKASARWESLRAEFDHERYGLVTLHRPSNVDDTFILGHIMDALNEISDILPIIFPIHPRTRKQIAECNFQAPNCNLHLAEPLGYLDFLALQRHATVVVTDSGGIQEETTFLGIPCLTVRENTERPITVEIGTNILVGQDMEQLKVEIHGVLEGEGKKGSIPPLWDGKANERISKIILDTFS
jgi:UDP-N-acetylglucosamine 2-epimerase (non-hydrolysing)